MTEKWWLKLQNVREAALGKMGKTRLRDWGCLVSSIYSVKNPPKATKQDDDASTIQVDNNAAAGESHSAFGISSTIVYIAMHTLLTQNNIIPMLEKCFKKEMEIWRALQDIKNRMVLWEISYTYLDPKKRGSASRWFTFWHLKKGHLYI